MLTLLATSCYVLIAVFINTGRNTSLHGSGRGAFVCTGCKGVFFSKEDLDVHELWCEKVDQKPVLVNRSDFGRDPVTDTWTPAGDNPGNCRLILFFGVFMVVLKL